MVVLSLAEYLHKVGNTVHIAIAPIFWVDLYPLGRVLFHI